MSNTKFSKRNYIVLASLIGKSGNLEEFESKLIEALEEDNTRFNPSRFRLAVVQSAKEVS